MDYSEVSYSVEHGTFIFRLTVSWRIGCYADSTSGPRDVWDYIYEDRIGNTLEKCRNLCSNKVNTLLQHDDGVTVIFKSRVPNFKCQIMFHILPCMVCMTRSCSLRSRDVFCMFVYFIHTFLKPSIRLKSSGKIITKSVFPRFNSGKSSSAGASTLHTAFGESTYHVDQLPSG